MTMALKMQSCEMPFQEKPMVSTKWNSIALIAVTTMLIFGILFTPLYLYSSQMNEKFYSLKKDFKKIMNDIEELKMKKEILEKETYNQNSFEHYVKVGKFGYFQKLENKMSFKNGQVACNKIHGKIIESDERNGNATKKLYDVGYRLKLNRKWRAENAAYSTSYKTYTSHANYGYGFDAPFYIGLIKNDNQNDLGQNQWRWFSTGRIISKKSLGKRGSWEGEDWDDWNYNWKLISWTNGANEMKKLRGNCAFINYDAELKEIDCNSKLTIICEEL